MLYWLHTFSDFWSPLRIFNYITFRSFMAAGTAFVLCLIVGPWLIKKLRQFQCVEQCEDARARSLDRSAKVGNGISIQTLSVLPSMRHCLYELE